MRFAVRYIKQMPGETELGIGGVGGGTCSSRRSLLKKFGVHFSAAIYCA